MTGAPSNKASSFYFPLKRAAWPAQGQKAEFPLAVLHLTMHYTKNATDESLAASKSPGYKQKINIIDEKTHYCLLWRLALNPGLFNSKRLFLLAFLTIQKPIAPSPSRITVVRSYLLHPIPHSCLQKPIAPSLLAFLSSEAGCSIASNCQVPIALTGKHYRSWGVSS